MEYQRQYKYDVKIVGPAGVFNGKFRRLRKPKITQKFIKIPRSNAIKDWEVPSAIEDDMLELEFGRIAVRDHVAYQMLRRNLMNAMPSTFIITELGMDGKPQNVETYIGFVESMEVGEYDSASSEAVVSKISVKINEAI